MISQLDFHEHAILEHDDVIGENSSFSESTKHVKLERQLIRLVLVTLIYTARKVSSPQLMDIIVKSQSGMTLDIIKNKVGTIGINSLS